MKNTRKKVAPSKTTKDSKRKDEIDKENLEKVISIHIFIHSFLTFYLLLEQNYWFTIIQSS